ncbi:MAG: hypothetical protein ACTH4U_17500 [Pseudoalteromonas prydzensis]|uniref:hypothetical protein n=1 Tax=Pseudoalteromonas prydzensis TaxID=182141 RepID=UPI003F9DF03B
MNIRRIFLLSVIFISSACTTSGQLYYVDIEGNEKLGCDVEFVGMPSVDKFAVEYALSLCAKSIVKKGGVIQESHLLKIDTMIPAAPCGEAWTHELAKQHFQSKSLSKKEYGYIVANIDLELAEINKCT